jgi:cephalosporin hydroxylase
VRAELEAYAPLVGVGSFIVAMDGHIMAVAAGSPAAAADWATNNANVAVEEFAAAHPEFEHSAPALSFNESALTTPPCGFRGGVLRRIR